MDRWISYAWVVLFMIVTASHAAFACADEPDLKALAAKLPVLSAESEDLKSFSFRGHIYYRKGLLIRFDAGWAAPDEAAALFSVGEDISAPVIFGSQGRLLLVDYFRGVVSLFEKLAPMLKTGVNDEGNVAFSIGATGKPTFEIDLGSFLTRGGDSPKWQRQGDGKWRYKNVSSTGKTHFIVDFDENRLYPLQKLQVFEKDEDFPYLVFDDIKLNEPLPQHLRSLPFEDRYPDDLVLEKQTFNKDKPMQPTVELTKQLSICLLGTGAIESDELRELFGGVIKVNWKQAEENHRKFGPALYKLLGPGEAE